MLNKSQHPQDARSIWVWGALIITLALTIWVGQQDESEELASPTEKIQRIRNAPSIPAPPQSQSDPMHNGMTDPNQAESSPTHSSETWGRQETSKTQANPTIDLFRPYALPAAPKAKSIAAKDIAPPMAPKPPFQYLGKLEEGSQTHFFLMSGNKVLTVQKGSIIDRQWKLMDEESQSIRFNFEPLNQMVWLPKTMKPLTRVPTEAPAPTQGM